MKSWSKKSLLVLLILCVMGFTSACGNNAGDASADNNAENTVAENLAPLPDSDKDYVVKLGYYNCDHMTGACIGKDAGIFDELGLKVEVIGNAKVPQAMSAGQMDVGYIGITGLIRSLPQGAPIFVAADNHIGGSYYIVASKNIKDPQELIGKKLSVGTDPEKNNGSWVLMTKSIGIPAEGSNYEVFNMTDTDEYYAMVTGKLDGMTCCDPWGSMAEFEGTGWIVAESSHPYDGEWGTCCVYSMNKDFAVEHPELAKRMVLAHTKAIEYIYTHPAQSAIIFANNYQVPPEVGLMTIYKKTVGEGRTMTWVVSEERINRKIQGDIKINTLDPELAPTMEQLVDTQFLDACGADDFDTFIKEQVDPVFPLGMTYEEWKTKALEIDGLTDSWTER